VLFVDGSSKQVGAIVYAMGYCIAFPVMATAPTEFEKRLSHAAPHRLSTCVQ